MSPLENALYFDVKEKFGLVCIALQKLLSKEKVLMMDRRSLLVTFVPGELKETKSPAGVRVAGIPTKRPVSQKLSIIISQGLVHH